jgi:hypothetical protein
MPHLAPHLDCFLGQAVPGMGQDAVVEQRSVIIGDKVLPVLVESTGPHAFSQRVEQFD